MVITALAAVLALFIELQRPELTDRLDEGLRDVLLQIAADFTPEERLSIIDIDEESIAEIGPWPWSRSQVADLVEILFAFYGARGVGLDMVFSEAGDANGDARLAALAVNTPLTLAQIFDFSKRSPPLALGILTGGKPAGTRGKTIPAHGYIANHPGLSNAKCIGNIGYIPDHDGILRRTPILTHYQGKDYISFASALLDCGHPSEPAVAPREYGDGQWRVPFRRAATAYSVIPAVDILKGRAPATLLAGRYILVGSSSLGLGDRVSTPLSTLTAGVMVHAASLSALLDVAEGHGHPHRSGRLFLLLWLGTTLSISLFCMPRLSAWSNIMVLSCFGAGWLSLVYWGVSLQMEGSLTAPLWAYVFLLITAIPFEWRLTQRHNHRLIDTFSHYVARPVLAEILRLDLAHSLDPTLREVTVLVADMEDYTRTTSSLTLEAAAALTKEFLDCLTRPVLDEGGTLDKYSGDGLVAFWGAPLPCPDQADRAISAGRAILIEVDAFNRRRQSQGLSPVRVRVGIESGNALVGDLGTTFRSTYTAVGDCINFASRLEAAARDLPTDLVIGAAAQHKVIQHQTIPLGEIHLRGTNTRIQVFTIETGLPFNRTSRSE